jgi:hypothetical protein
LVNFFGSEFRGSGAVELSHKGSKLSGNEFVSEWLHIPTWRSAVLCTIESQLLIVFEEDKRLQVQG